MNFAFIRQFISSSAWRKVQANEQFSPLFSRKQFSFVGSVHESVVNSDLICIGMLQYQSKLIFICIHVQKSVTQKSKKYRHNNHCLWRFSIKFLNKMQWLLPFISGQNNYFDNYIPTEEWNNYYNNKYWDTRLTSPSKHRRTYVLLTDQKVINIYLNICIINLYRRIIILKYIKTSRLFMHPNIGSTWESNPRPSAL